MVPDDEAGQMVHVLEDSRREKGGSNPVKAIGQAPLAEHLFSTCATVLLHSSVRFAIKVTHLKAIITRQASRVLVALQVRTIVRIPSRFTSSWQRSEAAIRGRSLVFLFLEKK